MAGGRSPSSRGCDRLGHDGPSISSASRPITPLPAELRGGVVAIGNFDGVHRGHQAVLERAREEAERRGVPALVLTFEPHPRTVFRPDVPLFLITPPPMKARLLAELGFDAVVEQAFTRDIRQPERRAVRRPAYSTAISASAMPSPASTSISARTARAARPS